MENAGLVVYLWSIWGNLVNVVTGVAFAGTLVILGIYFLLAVTEGEYDHRDKILWKSYICAVLLSVFTPSKENLLLIIAAQPVANTIISSYQDGKLQKLDQLTDIALDKAIIELKGK